MNIFFYFLQLPLEKERDGVVVEGGALADAGGNLKYN